MPVNKQTIIPDKENIAVAHGNGTLIYNHYSTETQDEIRAGIRSLIAERDALREAATHLTNAAQQFRRNYASGYFETSLDRMQAMLGGDE